MQREPIKNWSASHCLHRRADSWSMFNRRLYPWGWSVVRESKKFENAMTCGLQRATSRDTTFYSSDNVNPTHARKWWGVNNKHCSGNAIVFQSSSERNGDTLQTENAWMRVICGSKIVPSETWLLRMGDIMHQAAHTTLRVNDTLCTRQHISHEQYS